VLKKFNNFQMKKLIFAVFFSVKVGAPAGGRKLTATTFKFVVNRGDVNRSDDGITLIEREEDIHRQSSFLDYQRGAEDAVLPCK